MHSHIYNIIIIHVVVKLCARDDCCSCDLGYVILVTPLLVNYGCIQAIEDAGVAKAAVKTLS